MNDFHEGLAAAHTATAVYERLVQEVRQRVRVSAIHLMPFAPAADGKASSVLYLRNEDPENVRADVVNSVQAMKAQPGLPELFDQPQRALRVEDALGWERWISSPAYQQYFRRTESARQLVVGLVDSARTPRGFLAVCRSEADDVITEDEEALVLGLRDDAERALAAFDVVADWSRPTDGILEALTAALPVPALLTDGKHIVWMNREAELRLGVTALSFSRNTFYAGGTQAVEDLMAAVRRELHQPGSSLPGQARPARHQWLLPGESIIVRRLVDTQLPSCTLVCLCAPAPTPSSHPRVDELTSAYQLTAREADIATLAVKGYSVLNIASHLNIAESTVCTHLKRVYRKVGVRSRAELAWNIARGGQSSVGGSSGAGS